MFMIVGLVISAAFFALITAIPLKIAFRIVLKHSMEFGEAFKIMFFAGIIASIANIVVILAGLGDGWLGAGLSAGVLFLAVSYMLLHSAGLELGQSLAVGAVMTILYFLFSIFVSAILVESSDDEGDDDYSYRAFEPAGILHA